MASPTEKKPGQPKKSARPKISEKVMIALITGGFSISIALIGAYFSAQHLVKKNAFVLTGIVTVDIDEASQKKMTVGNGPRRLLRHVDFANEFDAPPTIILTIGSIDMYDGSTIELLNNKKPGQQDPDIASAGNRVRVFTNNVTTKGFDCFIETWSKTELYGIDINWYALPSQLRSN